MLMGSEPNERHSNSSMTSPLSLHFTARAAIACGCNGPLGSGFFTRLAYFSMVSVISSLFFSQKYRFPSSSAPSRCECSASADDLSRDCLCFARSRCFDSSSARLAAAFLLSRSAKYITSRLNLPSVGGGRFTSSHPSYPNFSTHISTAVLSGPCISLVLGSIPSNSYVNGFRFHGSPSTLYSSASTFHKVSHSPTSFPVSTSNATISNFSNHFPTYRTHGLLSGFNNIPDTSPYPAFSQPILRKSRRITYPVV
mmetsp:Transcript_12112/g.21899  ORF Transcript_12112/g.21899 Transcript_12112/m.21899 type:complete len:254 (-) Transcript_12112:778-1539(-)